MAGALFPGALPRANIFRPCGAPSRQLVRDVFVEDFLDGQGDDHLAGLLEELSGLGHRIAGVVEGNEEAFFPVVHGHHAFEVADVGRARLVLLLHLNRIPFVHEIQMPGFLALLCGGGADGIDASYCALANDWRKLASGAKARLSQGQIFA